MQITKEQIKNLSGIKVDLNNFSYVVLSCTLDRDLIIFDIVKASVYKKCIEDNGIIPSDKIETKSIKLRSLEPQNKICFSNNMENLTRSFTKIINILRQE